MQAVIGNSQQQANRQLSVGQLLGEAGSSQDLNAYRQQQLDLSRENAGVASRDKEFDNTYKMWQADLAERKYKIEEQQARAKASQDAVGLTKSQMELDRLNQVSAIYDNVLKSGYLTEEERIVLGKDPSFIKDYITPGIARQLRNDATEATYKMQEVNQKEADPFIQRYIDSKLALGESVTEIPYIDSRGINEQKTFTIPKGYTYQDVVDSARNRKISISEYLELVAKKQGK